MQRDDLPEMNAGAEGLLCETDFLPQIICGKTMVNTHASALQCKGLTLQVESWSAQVNVIGGLVL